MSTHSKLIAKIRENAETLLRAEGLRATVFRGGVWLGMGSFAEQAIRFGRNMLLARLLAPDAFGTMAIVLSATTLIQVLSEVGAREALIQNPRGTEEEYIGAAFWMSGVRALSIYAAIFLLAPFMARFYGNAELAALARIATLSIIFDGFISTRAIVAQKQMMFSKWAIVNNGGGILGVITTVVLSYFLRDVWALAIGYASENAVRCLLSYVVCPYLPKLHLDFAALRVLLRFSRGLFGLAFLNLIFTRADIFVLGKLYSAAQLGLYSMAIFLVQTPTVFMTAILSQTLLPALSHIQDDHPRMNRILLQVTSMTVMLGLPALVFSFFCGHSVLTLVYGQRYAAAAPALALAAAAAFLSLLNVQLTIVFYAKGLPQLHRRSVATMAVIVMALIYPFARFFGLWGGQLACLMAVLAGYLLQVERIRKVTGVRLPDYWKTFLAPTLASAAIAVFWLAAKSLPALAQPAPNIVFGLFGCLLACGAAWLFSLRRSSETI